MVGLPLCCRIVLIVKVYFCTPHSCRYIILGGSFDDFSNRWYDYVGESLMILLFIQTIFPLINVLLEFIKSWVKRALLRFNTEATQKALPETFNKACEVTKV
eukprot:324424-Pelagomonas_calceolata.AAC.4